MKMTPTVCWLADLSLLFLLLIAPTGCKHFVPSSANGPTAALILNEKTQEFDYSNPQKTNFFRTVYNNTKPGDEQKAVRNRIIDELMSLIDQNYRNYEVALRTDKNVKDLGTTLASMGLTAAATVAGGEETKTILAAIATGVIGANSVVDKTIFKDFGIETLQFEMQRLRAERAKTIFAAKKQSVADYSLPQAIGDLLEYYNAGFVTRALTSMVVQAGKGAETAKGDATTERLKK